MDSVRGHAKPLIDKRPKLLTRSPKMMPSYIVAFAVHETYDDIATAQQMICNKRSLQGSHTSVSPTMSTKTITLNNNSTNKLVDTDHEENTETKITIDEAEDNINSSPEVIGHHIIEDCIHTAFDSGSLEKLEHDITIDCNNTALNYVLDVRDNYKEENNEETHDIKLNTTITKKEYARRNLKKKKGNRKKNKNINFKYKKALKNEDQRSALIMKDTILTNSLSNVVSRSTLVKKNTTNENKQHTHNTNEQEDYVLSDQANFDEGSLQSSPSTIRGSFISNSSQNTIRQVSSSSLKNEITNLHKCDNKTSLKNSLPYGKDIVNVSVAVTYKPSPVQIKAEYKSSVTDNQISTDTLIYTSNITTSESAENQDRDAYLQNKQLTSPSDKTLTFEKKYSDLSSRSTNKTFVVGNTSSELDNIVISSEDTLAPNSETLMYSENLRPMTSVFANPELDKKTVRKPLLDTVINMGLLPEMNASTSSAIYFNDHYNNVYVTGDSNKLSRNTKYKDDITGNQENSKSVLKKPFEMINESNKHNNLTLPNESALQTAFNDSDKYCSGEFGTYPKTMNELWDRLVSVVDKAVRRLEDSLTEKIITEMRKSFTVIESNVNTLTQGRIIVGNQLDNNIFFSNKGIIVNPENTSQSQSLQCSLVGNQMIDNIMLKISTESPKVELPKSYCKSLQKIQEPNILKDYIEVLKPPFDKALVADTNKGDNATTSTAVASELEMTGSFHRVKSLLIGPLTFVRENITVIASVPAFFIGLLCAYGIVVLLMKPW